MSPGSPWGPHSPCSQAMRSVRSCPRGFQDSSQRIFSVFLSPFKTVYFQPGLSACSTTQPELWTRDLATPCMGPWRSASAPFGSPGPMLPEAHQAELIGWLESLEKPVGIFATNDQLATRLLDACRRAGIPVPEEVAVVGCENEATLCNFASPPLTSVRFAEVNRLLKNTDLTIEAIAEKTGFAYPHYLQTAYRERFGIALGKFRRKT